MPESNTINQEQVSRQLFHKKVEEAVKSVETQNINNYFVTDKSEKVLEIENTYYSIVESIYLLYTDTRIYPHCKLLNQPLESRVYVDFLIRPIEKENKINNIDYTMAYAMLQVVNEDKDRCLRYLVNKENPSTVLVIFFEDCIWDTENANSLLSATPVRSIPFVLNLIATPSVGYLLQEFLAFGEFNHFSAPPSFITSFVH